MVLQPKMDKIIKVIPSSILIECYVFDVVETKPYFPRIIILLPSIQLFIEILKTSYLPVLAIVFSDFLHFHEHNSFLRTCKIQPRIIFIFTEVRLLYFFQSRFYFVEDKLNFSTMHRSLSTFRILFAKLI